MSGKVKAVKYNNKNMMEKDKEALKTVLEILKAMNYYTESTVVELENYIKRR